MLKHQVSLILGLRRACVQGMVQRNPQRVLDLVNGLIKITSEYETFKGARDSIIFRCWGQFHANRDTSLLDTMQACIEHFDATKHWAMLPFFMASTAELRGAAGDSTGAAALLDRASELIGKTGEEWCLPEIIRLQARFCSRNPAEAGALLQGALTNARRQGAKLWELRIATSLAELWRYQNNAAALGALAPVYNWFTEGSGTSDLISARTLLDELGLAH
jgi:predicted ATPase